MDSKLRAAIIGSRETPKEIMDLAIEFAYEMIKRGVSFESGGAERMDKVPEIAYWRAHYEGAARGDLRVYLPFPSFEGYERYADTAEYVNTPQLPNWDEARILATRLYNNYGRNKPLEQLSAGIQSLSYRNMYQVLGESLARPKDFIVFWAKPARDKRLIVEGGTNLAVALGDEYGIPMVNLFYPEQQELLRYVTKTGDIDLLLKKARY